MNRLLLLLIFLFCLKLQSQTLDKFEYLGDLYANDEYYVGLYPTYTFISNKAAPNPQNHDLKGWTGELNIRKVNFSKGKLRWSMQQKMFPDVLLILNKSLQKGDPNAIYRKENTSITNGIIGWLDFTINLNKPDGKLLFAVGVNHNDYFYGATYSDTTRNSSTWATYDPQGYFLAAGPSLIINFLPVNFLMMELSTSYSLSYKKVVDVSYATNPNPNYPLPHWGQIDIELQTKWGFFTGFNYNWIINRGNIPSSGKRFDMLLGFRFML
jgi:hypothetical protein